VGAGAATRALRRRPRSRRAVHPAIYSLTAGPLRVVRVGGWSIFQSKNDPEIDFRFQYKMILKI
jgi:hypothetical protein